MPDSSDGGAARVAAALAQAGLHGRLKGFAETTRSAAEAAQAIGCAVAAIAKSIVLRAGDAGGDAPGTAGGEGRAVVVVVSGAARVDEGKVAAAIGLPVGKANARFVRERTGYAIGGVSPLALPGDAILLIDRGLFDIGEIWAAAGTPFAVFRTTASELVQLTGARPAAVAAQADPQSTERS